jgi:hypothetical protein
MPVLVLLFQAVRQRDVLPVRLNRGGLLRSLKRV